MSILFFFSMHSIVVSFGTRYASICQICTDLHSYCHTREDYMLLFSIIQKRIMHPALPPSKTSPHLSRIPTKDATKNPSSASAFAHYDSIFTLKPGHTLQNPLNIYYLPLGYITNVALS